MKLYRYEFQKGDVNIGILAGLDDFFTVDEILSVCGIFEAELKLPCIDMTNTESWFTEQGNRKFRKAIRKINRLADSKEIEFIIRVKDLDNLEDLLYKDEYQAVLIRDD